MFFKVLVMSVILFCFCFWYDQHIHSHIPHTHICQDKIVSVNSDTPAYQYGQKKKVEGNWLRKKEEKKAHSVNQQLHTKSKQSYAKHMGVCINKIGLFWFLSYSQAVRLKCPKPFVKTVFASSLWHSTSSGLVVSLFFLSFFKDKRGNQRKNEEIQTKKKRNGWKGTVRLYHCRKPSHLPACGALSGRWRTWSSCWTSSTAAPGTWSAASVASVRTAAASPASPSALASRWGPTWTPLASETRNRHPRVSCVLLIMNYLSDTPSGFLCVADHELSVGQCWSPFFVFGKSLRCCCFIINS